MIFLSMRRIGFSQKLAKKLDVNFVFVFGGVNWFLIYFDIVTEIIVVSSNDTKRQRWWKAEIWRSVSVADQVSVDPGECCTRVEGGHQFQERQSPHAGFEPLERNGVRRVYGIGDSVGNCSRRNDCTRSFLGVLQQNPQGGRPDNLRLLTPTAKCMTISSV